jgi:hypothetical protein
MKRWPQDSNARAWVSGLEGVTPTYVRLETAQRYTHVSRCTTPHPQPIGQSGMEVKGYGSDSSS